MGQNIFNHFLLTCSLVGSPCVELHYLSTPCTGLAIQKTTRSMESSPDNLETFLATQRERHRNIFR
jgi:hypothetical protein